MKGAAQALRWVCSYADALPHRILAPLRSGGSLYTQIPDLQPVKLFTVRERRCLPLVLASSIKTAPGQHVSPGAALSLQNIEDRLGTLSSDPTVPPATPVVVVISGPSGVGKDAVISALRESRQDLFFVVTATSRPKRQGEVHGEDYIFVSTQTFEDWIEGNHLLEHAVVYGDYKGIPKRQVEDALQQGTDVVMRIDVQGAATIRRLLPRSIFVFLVRHVLLKVAESEVALVQRLTQRKTEPLESMLVRVQTAREELTHMQAFDYVVVNREGQLAATVNQISSIIDAEKSAVQRRLTPVVLTSEAGDADSNS